MNLQTLQQESDKDFDEKFLYWVILGSTLNNGSELRWNVGDGRMPDIDKIKSFHHLQLEKAYKIGLRKGVEMVELLIKSQ